MRLRGEIARNCHASPLQVQILKARLVIDIRLICRLKALIAMVFRTSCIAFVMKMIIHLQIATHVFSHDELALIGFQ